ncbi:class I SAM-dependent methyltransferase [Candidatus Magnetaquicoccus inordinatus]|uniref:class I SAM-dependent methyltransferase n=1 Tax=Candidatus Magnetaquicoccus inordinatus TaxID=2496818 RepID=UPI001D0EB788|nr:class I SAM-dependent methyltransferase [Candidatus Magnetaquicoccus inordinatus]
MLNNEQIFSRVAVFDATGQRHEEASALAERLCLPLLAEQKKGGHTEAELIVVLQAEHIELQGTVAEEGGAIVVDFVAGKAGYRRRHGGGWRQPLVRALGLRAHKPLRIVDATPGLGQDAFVLAALGAEVKMVERSPVLAVLLEDGLRRLRAHSQIHALPQVLLTLERADSRCWLASFLADNRGERPDVIYLDPMYPHRQGSALVKKEMRRLRRLVGDDNDAEELLPLAMQVAQSRVVVKRPRHAAHLAALLPTMVIESEQTRYDIYRLG